MTRRRVRAKSSESDHAAPPIWRTPLAAWAILGVAVLICYANTFDNAYVYDDVPYILENAIVQGAMPAEAAFTHSYPPHKPELSLYRPLPELLFAACWKIGLLTADRPAPGQPQRADAWPFHAMNMMLHWVVCGLMFHFWLGLMARLRNGAPCNPQLAYFIALAAALIFAAHPAHVESVAAMAGAVDLLAAALVLAAIMLAMKFMTRTDLSGPLLIAAAACFFLALLSKENAAVATLLLIVFGLAVRSHEKKSDLTSVNRQTQTLLAVSSFAAVMGIYLAIRIAVIGTPGIAAEDHYFGPGEDALRLMSIPVVFLLNAKIMLWPAALCADYNFPIRLAGDWFIAAPESWLNAWVIAGLAAMSGYGAALAWLWRRHRAAALGLAWFGIALLPTSQIIPFGDLLGERFLYLPAIGLCFAVVAIAVDIIWPRIRRASDRLTLNHFLPLMAAGSIVLVLLAARTIVRNEAWSSPRAFWLAVQRDAPGNPEAWYGFAHAVAAERAEALARGDVSVASDLEREAITAYEETIRRSPNYLAAYLNLANLQFESTSPNPARARELLQQMIARAGDRPDIRFAGWVRLGQNWMNEENWSEARAALERAAESREMPEALVMLGVACARLNDLPAAEQAWRRALALDPANAQAQANLRRLEAMTVE